MLNQLLRFTLVSGALLWLRPRWKGLLALGVFVLLVHVLHGEYLGYVELSENAEFLVWSYLVKWLALIAGVLAYFFLAVFKGGAAASAPAQKPEATTAASAKDNSSADAEPEKGDGFDFLRGKKQLEGRAEKLLNRGPRGD